MLLPKQRRHPDRGDVIRRLRPSLDGQLLEKALYDTAGTCVAKQVQTWGVERRAADPVSGVSFVLKGLWVHLTQTAHTLGTATTVQNFTYDPGSGTVMQTDVATSNALGQKERRRRTHPGVSACTRSGTSAYAARHR